MNDIFRYACIGILFYSLLMLWQKWDDRFQVTNDNTPVVNNQTEQPSPTKQNENADSPPQSQQLITATESQSDAPPTTNAAPDTALITLQNEWLQASISEGGGNLVELKLKHHTNATQDDFLALFENNIHGAQSGLIGGDDDDFPYHRSPYILYNTPNFNSDSITVELASNSGGVMLIKRYIFNNNEPFIRLQLESHNTTDKEISPKAYFQIFHSGALPPQVSSFLPSFFGAAVYTDADKFQKIDYDDIGIDKFAAKSADGWIGFIQRYFAAVWLPEKGVEREYFMRAPKDSSIGARIGVIIPYGNIAPGQNKIVSTRLFANAQEQSALNDLNETGDAPGMHLVVDYGWLTFIAILLFKALAFIQSYAHNWGISIILLTFMVKLAFYPLASISYRSIARMKELAPRIKNLQAAHKDDKQKMQQSMMALYKEKKINPFGGCLPVLLQIPVFIALYWVILGSVELRHAPFYGWITDLSASDPYFILPLAMGISMFFQTRMSPTPPDPTQAMIIKIMPIFFTVFSLFFPSGLVLYWLVNTLLSISQQWHITRSIARAKSAN